MGYDYSAVLAPPRVTDSRVFKPLRKVYRGRPVFALGILSRQTCSDVCRGLAENARERTPS